MLISGGFISIAQMGLKIVLDNSYVYKLKINFSVVRKICIYTNNDMLCLCI